MTLNWTAQAEPIIYVIRSGKVIISAQDVILEVTVRMVEIDLLMSTRQ